MLTTVRHIFGRIMHSETALCSQWDKGWKNNLLFASPSIRRPTVYDQLYANAGNNAKFTHLMQIVMSAENIKLAYRNIKKNKGSDTRGTDGKTIRDYESMNEEEMIAYFQSKMMNYNPKSVRRVEIPVKVVHTIVLT